MHNQLDCQWVEYLNAGTIFEKSNICYPIIYEMGITRVVNHLMPNKYIRTEYLYGLIGFVGFVVLLVATMALTASRLAVLKEDHPVGYGFAIFGILMFIYTAIVLLLGMAKRHNS